MKKDKHNLLYFKQNNKFINDDRADLCEDSYNIFYDRVSVVYRLFSFLLFLLFIIFIVVSSFLGAESFNYNSVEYIMRNFALRLEENSLENREPIRYNSDMTMSYSLIGQGLAVCGNTTLNIYSATGRQTCLEFPSYMKPTMRSSDKFVFVYDYLGKSYSVYNTFSKIYSGKTEKNIRGATIADNGYFALITSTDEYNSVVEVYNDDFNLITRYNKNGYVIAADINFGKLLIVTVTPDNVNNCFYSEIILSDLEENYTKVIEYDSQFPLEAALTEYGFVILYKNQVMFFDYSTKQIGEYLFDQNELADFSISDTHVLLLFEKPGIDIVNNVICIDKFGNKFYHCTINESVFDIDLFDSTAFVLTNNKVLAIDDKAQNSIQIQNADYQCELLSVSNQSVYFCSTIYADYLDFSKRN